MLQSKGRGCWRRALLTVQLRLDGVPIQIRHSVMSQTRLPLLNGIRLERFAGLNFAVIACRPATVVFCSGPHYSAWQRCNCF